jgi:SAM-dependent methyltransferase
MSCCQCEGIRQEFDPRFAKRELRRYLRSGLRKTTRLLLEGIRARGVRNATLLDIGGGVGAIHHELLGDGTVSASVDVDASPAYLSVARDETLRRGNADRVRFIEGDFVELAPSLESADIVTLDRVICCYPDMAALVSRSAGLARRTYAVVYPRERFLTRTMIPMVNGVQRIRRSSFRVFLHSPAAIDAVVRELGFTRASLRRTIVWEIAVYAR